MFRDDEDDGECEELERQDIGRLRADAESKFMARDWSGAADAYEGLVGLEPSASEWRIRLVRSLALTRMYDHDAAQAAMEAISRIRDLSAHSARELLAAVPTSLVPKVVRFASRQRSVAVRHAVALLAVEHQEYGAALRAIRGPGERSLKVEGLSGVETASLAAHGRWEEARGCHDAEDDESLPADARALVAMTFLTGCRDDQIYGWGLAKDALCSAVTLTPNVERLCRGVLMFAPNGASRVLREAAEFWWSEWQLQRDLDDPEAEEAYVARRDALAVAVAEQTFTRGRVLRCAFEAGLRAGDFNRSVRFASTMRRAEQDPYLQCQLEGYIAERIADVRWRAESVMEGADYWERILAGRADCAERDWDLDEHGAWLAHAILCPTLAALKDYERASRIWRTVDRFWRLGPEHLFEWGLCALNSGDNERGRHLFDQLAGGEFGGAACYLNLGLAHERCGSIPEAKRTISAGLLRFPTDERLQGRHRGLQAREQAEALDAARHRAARMRWGELKPYELKILQAWNLAPPGSSQSDVQEISGVNGKWFAIGMSRLLKLEMLVDVKGGRDVNPDVVDLLTREQSHDVAIRVGRIENGDDALKPVFDSGFEREVYSLLVTLFPNHLVFPNMAPSSFLQYERMRELLDEGEFTYFLRCRVDFCVVSTATYMPLLGIEVDSAYHDTPEAHVRDARKNRILAVGGVPLVRLRRFGSPTLNLVRHRLHEATSQALRTTDERRHRQLLEIQAALQKGDAVDA